MLTIADYLNVANERVAVALEARDRDAVEALVRSAEALGADMLDLNLGFGRRSGPDTMRWLVAELAASTDLDICLDSANPAVLKAGLEEAVNQGLGRPPLINSFSLEPAKTESILPLAVDFRAEIIGYCVTKGVPRSDEERLSEAVELVAVAEEAGVPRERLYLDPILFPLVSFQEDLSRVLTFVEMLPEVVEPAPRVVVGLSNVGYGLPTDRRGILEGAVLCRLAGHGLDAALLDPRSREVRNALAVIRATNLETVFSAADLEPPGA